MGTHTFYVMMHPHSQTSQHAPDNDQALAGNGSGPTDVDERAEVAEDVDTVSIELNFKAFADNVPPDRHAERERKYDDPSIQDFADQALEIAALRAELKRLTRDYEVVQQQVRLRDARLEALRRELSVARTQLRDAERPHAQAPASQDLPVSTGSDGSSAATAGQPESLQPSRPQPTMTLEIPLVGAEHSDPLESTVATEAAPKHHTQESTPKEPTQSSAPQNAPPQLIPLDRPEKPFALSRDVVTIGRMRSNDICIFSRAVSRDHARLLVMGNCVTLFDISTTNGCFVNDQPVKRHKLRDGDLVRIGDRSFRFASAPSAGR